MKILIFLMTLFCSNAQALLITEVFTATESIPANTSLGGACTKVTSSSNQYVEIYNNSGTPIDLNNHKLKDGTGTDTIVAWNSASHGTLNDGITIMNDNSTILPAGAYGLILDPDYGKCNQHLNVHLKGQVYLFSVSTAGTPGQSTKNLGSTNLGPTESLQITQSDSTTVIATFGSAGGAFVPSSAGTGNSWEMISLLSGDVAGNWETSNTHGSKSMGYASSITLADLIITEVLSETLIGNHTTPAPCTSTLKRSTGQFIEIYNNGSEAVDLTGIILFDSSSSDTIVAWDNSYHGVVSGSFTHMNNHSAILPAGAFGLILDPDYASCEQFWSAHLSGNVYLFSIYNSFDTLPGSYGIGNGLDPTDKISILNPSIGLEELSSYGAPQTIDFPFDPRDENSVERKTLTSTDIYANWQNGKDCQGNSPGRANSICDNTKIVITEVMNVLASTNNICCDNGLVKTQSTTMEYIELYNNGISSIDLSAFSITDGVGIDHLSAWTIAGNDALRHPELLINSTILAPGKYAIILDPDHARYGDQAYNYPPGSLILSVGTAAGTNGIGTSGLAATEPITLYNGDGLSISSFGTPVASTKSTYTLADDDGDGFPFNQASNRSWERVNIGAPDTSSNWQISTDIGLHSPAGPNTTAAGFVKLDYANTESTITVGNTETVIGTFDLTTPQPVFNLGLASIENMDNFDGTVAIKLYLDNGGGSTSLSGSEVMKGTFEKCPDVRMVNNLTGGGSTVYFGKRDLLPLIEGRKIVLEDSNIGTEILQTTYNSFDYLGGILSTFSSITGAFSMASNSKFKCLNGSWLLENVQLVSGTYKMTMTASVKPSANWSVRFINPLQWVINNANQTNTRAYYTPLITIPNN
ncbi:MAG TPA: hypothetical protein VNJ08_12915 [Bacteriovoracaceae bacterium]|nr:hypothetical protein [Bacteriovoracaceae bacterium]